MFARINANVSKLREHRSGRCKRVRTVCVLIQTGRRKIVQTVRVLIQAVRVLIQAVVVTSSNRSVRCLHCRTRLEGPISHQYFLHFRRSPETSPSISNLPISPCISNIPLSPLSLAHRQNESDNVLHMIPPVPWTCALRLAHAVRTRAESNPGQEFRGLPFARLKFFLEHQPLLDPLQSHRQDP